MMTKMSKAITLTMILAFVAAPAWSGNLGEENIRTIEIKGMDNLKYDVEEIVASPGETLRIVLTTVSNMPPAAMQHNIAILDLGTDIETFVNASIAARDNEYIAPDMEDQVIAFTDMIGGGETSTIEFTVPETPGEYVYVCTFPGHYPAGMKGILKVE